MWESTNFSPPPSQLQIAAATSPILPLVLCISYIKCTNREAPQSYFLFTDGSDFLASSKVVALAPGETEDRVKVPIIDDSIAEETETFTATLSTGDVDLDSNDIATVTILDDDNKGMYEPSILYFNG